MTVGSELVNEVERVSAIREQYQSLRAMRGVNVEPAIALMTAAIEAAKDSMLSDDPLLAIRCLKRLQEFSA